MSRLLPEPSTGLPAAASGVSLASPRTPADGSLLARWPASTCPKRGWFRTLKNSARNWALSRSLILKSLVTEKSQVRNGGLRKTFFPPRFEAYDPGNDIRLHLQRSNEQSCFLNGIFINWTLAEKPISHKRDLPGCALFSIQRAGEFAT